MKPEQKAFIVTMLLLILLISFIRFILVFPTEFLYGVAGLLTAAILFGIFGDLYYNLVDKFKSK